MSNDQSPSKEELEALSRKIDKRLAELRADPTKAGASRADLASMMRAALQERPRVNLTSLISEAFSFLVSEHAFEEHPVSSVGQFGMTPLKRFTSAKVDVFVWAGGVDNPSFCGIFFENTQTKERWEFEDLLHKRAPGVALPRNVESTEAAQSHLQAYATALKNHARDVLEGDFSVFSD